MHSAYHGSLEFSPPCVDDLLVAAFNQELMFLTAVKQPTSPFDDIEDSIVADKASRWREHCELPV